MEFGQVNCFNLRVGTLGYVVCNDKVLVDELRDRVNVKLERWQEALESKGFRISRIKT